MPNHSSRCTDRWKLAYACCHHTADRFLAPSISFCSIDPSFLFPFLSFFPLLFTATRRPALVGPMVVQYLGDHHSVCCAEDVCCLIPISPVAFESILASVSSCPSFLSLPPVAPVFLFDANGSDNWNVALYHEAMSAVFGFCFFFPARRGQIFSTPRPRFAPLRSLRSQKLSSRSNLNEQKACFW
jgi:hypothetical protein